VSALSTILLLQFPPSNSSLYYDPLIGLAELQGQKGSDSSNDEFLIIGVVLGGSAALLVFGVILLVVMAKINYKRGSVINFEPEQLESSL